MARVLVTGANGFLGSWVTRALVSEGHDVCCLVRKTSDLSELANVKCKFLYGDVTDLSSVERACEGIESVFHLAGLIAYRKADRALMEEINVGGTVNVLVACEKNKVQRLVYLSSVVAIGAGRSPTEILDENSSYNIGHLNLGYFQTKHKAEQLVLQARKLDRVILNPSTIYGPGDAKKGSRKTQLKVAQGKFKFYTTGGASVVAVEDVVAGILSAWKKGKTGERYILSGENLLIKDLFGLIAECAGVAAPHIRIPTVLLHALGIGGDLLTHFGKNSSLSRENAYTATMYHWFNSSKAQRDLDFQPKPAKIAISQSVQWMKENGLLS
jgi:dihydroflavonol-4-reductase